MGGQHGRDDLSPRLKNCSSIHFIESLKRSELFGAEFFNGRLKCAFKIIMIKTPIYNCKLFLNQREIKMLLLISTEPEKFYPLEFFLKQNEPNPFASKTKIKYCVAYKTKVILLVIDNDGNVVEKIISKEQDAGVYEIEFKADGLAEGTYYYQLIAGNYSATKKMELNKKAEIPPQHSNEEGGNCL
jgi:hypothetical protein